jgi:protein-glutamine gamma-glutamyltransferase
VWGPLLARTLVLYALAALLVATAWLRLVNGDVDYSTVVLMVALGLLPTVAVAVGKHWAALGIAGATLLAASSEAFRVPVTEARWGGEHDFFGPVLGSFQDGFLQFYDTELPFRPDDFPVMHSVVLLAIFAFSAATGMLLAARRPVAAAVVLVVGLGWPATLVPGGRPVALGVLALAAVLAVLFLFRAGTRPTRGLAQGIAVGIVLVGLAAAASSSDAVAKGAFLRWQGWDPYDRPDDPVGVSYVWNSHYQGIRFPEKKTTVFKIRVSGSQRSLFWRATTLSDYTGNSWQESLDLGPITQGQIDAAGLPTQAHEEDDWVQQEVTVEALRDTHLVASAQPVRWDPPENTDVQHQNGDIVVLPRALHRGQRYTVWSYVPRVTPTQLARAGTDYPESIERYLQTIQGGAEVTPFGTPNRDDLMHVFFEATYDDDVLMQANRPLYDVAREVSGEAESPYAATVALEAWFRRFGGFRYDERPPQPEGTETALAAFVTRTKRGYCQHYAGAMALMLRYLGVPARVAAGFTSGSYDSDEKEWTVTDHNAHDWVEVYFPGYGWMPFDPTPGRGLLNAAYSVSSPSFDTRDAPEALGGQSQFLEALRTEAAEAQGRPGLESFSGTSSGAGGAGGTVVQDKGPSIVALAFLVLAAAVGLVIGIKALRRALRFTGSDPRSLAAACRRDLVGYLADQGFELAPSATLAEVGAVLDRYYAVDGRPFVEAATLARFGRPGDVDEAASRARRELRRIRRDLRHQLSVLSRFRGAVSLRSLTI